MNWLPLCVALAAAFFLVYWHDEKMNPKRFCPLCGGSRRHGPNCPQKDRDE